MVVVEAVVVAVEEVVVVVVVEEVVAAAVEEEVVVVEVVAELEVQHDDNNILDNLGNNESDRLLDNGLVELLVAEAVVAAVVVPNTKHKDHEGNILVGTVQCIVSHIQQDMLFRRRLSALLKKY